jgi:hypothetical protein
LTITGLLLVVTNLPRSAFELPASFEVLLGDNVPLAKTKTLTTARRTNKETILIGRALNRMVLPFFADY